MNTKFWLSNGRDFSHKAIVQLHLASYISLHAVCTIDSISQLHSKNHFETIYLNLICQEPLEHVYDMCKVPSNDNLYASFSSKAFLYGATFFREAWYFCYRLRVINMYTETLIYACVSAVNPLYKLMLPFRIMGPS